MNAFIDAVCARVIRAARDYGKDEGRLAASFALERYCKLGTNLQVEDQQFCYNIDSMKSDIYKLLDYGAKVSRVCKKVKAMNSDFCVTKSSKKTVIQSTGIQINERYKRGIIYI